MNIALQKPWTAERFLDWADAQGAPYEFDGVRPVAMAGGNARHDTITGNLNLALRSRLRGTPCSTYGPNLGVRTIDGAIRYPDALITCTRFPDSDRLAPDPVAVFEVISPTSGKVDRIIKLREYEAVPSILRYVIIESKIDGLQVLHRDHGNAAWTAHALTRSDTLDIPEAGVAVPVVELYEGIEFEDETALVKDQSTAADSPR